MDRYTKVGLTLIVLLMIAIALKPTLYPQSVNAAAQHQYMNLLWTDTWADNAGDALDDGLNKYGAQGWELVGVVPLNRAPGGATTRAYLILRK